MLIIFNVALLGIMVYKGSKRQGFLIFNVRGLLGQEVIGLDPMGTEACQEGYVLKGWTHKTYSEV